MCVIATVKTLSSCGLPFCSSSDKLGSSHNGNYMIALEFIAEFDPFLSNHIKDLKMLEKEINHTACNCITNVSRIYMIAHKVRRSIDKIKKAKYYAIIISTFYYS